MGFEIDTGLLLDLAAVLFALVYLVSLVDGCLFDVFGVDN